MIENYENEEPISPLSRFGFENIDIKLYTINQLKALVKSCWNGESITQYNLYGEIMQEYNNPIDLSIKYDVPIHVIIQRVKEIEDLAERGEGVTVSEGIDANYMDIINYAVFGAIKLSEE